MNQGKAQQTIVLQNQVGVKWTFPDRGAGFTAGSIWFNQVWVEAENTVGMIALYLSKTGETHWLPAIEGIQKDKRTAHFSGDGLVEGVGFAFEVVVQLDEHLPAAQVNYQWVVEDVLDGWQVCLGVQAAFAHDWACHLYPFAADSKHIAVDPLTYVGVPAALMLREDQAVFFLFGIDPAFNYLDPTDWTGDTGFFFTDRVTSPQFRVGEDGLSAGLTYHFPLQLVFSDQEPYPQGITDLVCVWNTVNNVQIEQLFVRSPDEALSLFLKGRLNTSMWNPGIGYQLEEGDPESYFVYLGEQPLSAYFEYLIYEHTGNVIWRQRCFEQMVFMLRAQNKERDSRHYGAFHTAYDLGKRDFDSDDRGNNIGYKPDLNAYMARYMLQTWQRVRENEGIDHQEWYQAALRAADWVLRQRNPDGGLPQVVDISTGRNSISVVSGRTLPAMEVIAQISGEKRYLVFAQGMERFLRECVEGRLWFTGHHPDLPPDEIEEASIWGIVEYWLAKYERMGDEEALQRATAGGYLSFLWWCPKQLDWVKNPTQCASAEQQHFLQYSIYCYQNRKLECLHRLYQYTEDSFFKDLFNRVLQGVFWTQVTEGDLMGATHERICDPWLARKDYGVPADFNSLGTVYMGEQSLDTMLQLVEMGLADPQQVSG